MPAAVAACGHYSINFVFDIAVHVCDNLDAAYFDLVLRKDLMHHKLIRSPVARHLGIEAA